ncbi:DUF5707 domain-containing protein [Streptomyces sp. NPDC060198]|uniref:DUF5707 domain-containing protein n=1 Tax=Streptomyces sp. NPDC060198 TaxID=3347070 RepID=UPI00364A2151
MSKSKRVLVSSAVGVVALGAIAAGGYAMASTTTELTVENSSVLYTAPTSRSAGKLSYSADVSDDSGVRSLKDVAWPKSSKLDPTAAELRHVDGATCRSTSDETVHCTYAPTVSKRDADESADGTWYVSVLATAKDGDTEFVARAATFEVTR